MRPIAALAMFLAGASAVAAQSTCPTTAEGLSRPVEAHPARWTYTEGPDRVVISTTPSWVEHSTLGGDDTVFVMSPPASATIYTGTGADVVVICSLRQPSLLLVVSGDVESDEPLGDGAADLIVIEPEVFLGAPEGVTIQIAVMGFTVGEDRIRLRLPPGVTPRFNPSLVTTLRAGPIAINVVPTDPYPGLVGPESFEIVPAAPTYQPVWPPPAPAFTGYDPALTCASAPPVAATPARSGMVTTAGDPQEIAIHSPSSQPLRIEAGDTAVVASDAADRLLVFDGSMVLAGEGGDQIVICGFAGEYLSVAAGPGSVPALDLDPDTIVVEAGRLQDAPRTLSISNLNPLNDRIVLRLPPGLEPQFELSPGFPHVQVGALRITTLAQVWEPWLAVHIDPAMFAIDRRPAP